MFRGQDRQELSGFTPGYTTSVDDGTFTSTTTIEGAYLQDSRSCIQPLVEYHLLQLVWSALNCASQVTTSWAHIVRVGSDFAFETTALFVYTEPTS